MKNKSTKRKANKRKLNDKKPWGDVEAKREAFLKIMENILKKPSLGDEYVKSDEKAAKAFQDAGMIVPPDVKVVFLPAGDTNKSVNGSALIELPPTGATNSKPSEREQLDLFLCSYNII